MITTAWSPANTDAAAEPYVGSVEWNVAAVITHRSVPCWRVRPSGSWTAAVVPAGGSVGSRAIRGRPAGALKPGQLWSGLGDSGPALLRATSLPSPGQTTGSVAAGPLRPRMTSRAAPALVRAYPARCRARRRIPMAWNGAAIQASTVAWSFGAAPK